MIAAPRPRPQKKRSTPKASVVAAKDKPLKSTLRTARTRVGDARITFGGLAVAEADGKKRGPRDHELPKPGEDPVAWRARNAVRQLETLAFALSIPDLEPDLRMYAAAKLDVIWEAIHGLRAGSWPRLVFMRCINMGAEHARRGKPEPEIVALTTFLVFERPLGLKLSGVLDALLALVKVWAGTDAAAKGKADRKWKMAASLWNSTSGEKVTPDTMKGEWERDRGKANTNKRRGDS